MTARVFSPTPFHIAQQASGEAQIRQRLCVELYEKQIDRFGLPGALHARPFCGNRSSLLRAGSWSAMCAAMPSAAPSLSVSSAATVRSAAYDALFPPPDDDGVPVPVVAVAEPLLAPRSPGAPPAPPTPSTSPTFVSSPRAVTPPPPTTPKKLRRPRPVQPTVVVAVPAEPVVASSSDEDDDDSSSSSIDLADVDKLTLDGDDEHSGASSESDSPASVSADDDDDDDESFAVSHSSDDDSDDESTTSSSSSSSSLSSPLSPCTPEPDGGDKVPLVARGRSAAVAMPSAEQCQAAFEAYVDAVMHERAEEPLFAATEPCGGDGDKDKALPAAVDGVVRLHAAVFDRRRVGEPLVRELLSRLRAADARPTVLDALQTLLSEPLAGLDQQRPAQRDSSGRRQLTLYTPGAPPTQLLAGEQLEMLLDAVCLLLSPGAVLRTLRPRGSAAVRALAREWLHCAEFVAGYECD